jgi:hypothetical protein
MLIPDVTPPATQPIGHTDPAEDEQMLEPSTPIPYSKSHSIVTSTTDNASGKQSKSDTPRHFLTPLQRNTPIPKGFKQLQRRRPNTVTPDRATAAMGDGFSTIEALPTGLVQVGGSKRKFCHPIAVSLGRLDLTQASASNTEERSSRAEKKMRFTRTRRKEKVKDDPFDGFDAVLAHVKAKTALGKQKEDKREIPETPPRIQSPVLGEISGQEEPAVLAPVKLKPISHKPRDRREIPETPPRSTSSDPEELDGQDQNAVPAVATADM